jgi:hypothetical protein
MHLIPLLMLTLLVLLPACGSRSPDESCGVVCDTSALCNEDVDAASCKTICLELAKEDESYAEGTAVKADCYEENADNYDKETGVCIAIRGGACSSVEP